jgi:hypothetical protein
LGLSRYDIIEQGHTISFFLLDREWWTQLFYVPVCTQGIRICFVIVLEDKMSIWGINNSYDWKIVSSLSFNSSVLAQWTKVKRIFPQPCYHNLSLFMHQDIKA